MLQMGDLEEPRVLHPDDGVHHLPHPAADAADVEGVHRLVGAVHEVVTMITGDMFLFLFILLFVSRFFYYVCVCVLYASVFVCL